MDNKSKKKYPWCHVSPIGSEGEDRIYRTSELFEIHERN